MDREKEESLIKTYQVFMDIGLGAEDLGRLPAIVDERIFGIGTAVDEKIYGIPDVEKLIENQKKQSTGLDISWKQAPICRYITEDENTAVFADEIYLTIRAGEEIMDMYLRFSVVLYYVNGHWKVIHWHGSKPEHVESDKDTWGIYSWKKRAEELERLVVEKTADLVTKNRELEIVAALENVRAAAMGMRQPADMADVCRTISQSLDNLGFTDIRNVQTAVFYPEKGIYLNYEYFGDGERSLITEVVYRDQPDVHAFVNEMLAGTEAGFMRTFHGEEVREWTAYQHSAGQYVPSRQETAEVLHYAFYSIGPGALGLSAYTELTAEQHSILRRFRDVFELAYTRYSDIEQAQAQAREAQVEAALERVRARSLAMHHTNELNDVVTVLFEKLNDLRIPATAVGIAIYINGSKDYHAYVCGQTEGRVTINRYRVPYFNHRIANDLYAAREKGLDFFSGHYSKAEKDSYYDYVIEHSALKRELPDDIKAFIRQSPSYTISAFPNRHAVIHLNDFEGKSLSDNEIDVLKRFSHVFDQVYTRFLDLQKAEAQAREAQVEAALEKIRSRSLAMHKSAEMTFVMEELLDRIRGLDIDFDAAFIIEFKNESLDIWSAYSAGTVGVTTIPSLAIDVTYFKDVARVKNAGDAFFSHQYAFDEKNRFLDYIFEHTNFQDIPDERKQYLYQANCYTVSIGFGRNTAIQLHSYSRPAFSASENDILKRVVHVFEQAYTRFLDLQKAEAQAREAEVELALERIRAQAMAMRESADLLDIVVTMRNEFTRLGHEAGYFWHMMWLPEKYEKAMTSGDGTRIGMVMELPRHIHGEIPLLADWEKGQESMVVYPMDVDAAVAYVDKMIRLGDFKQVDPQAPTLEDIRHIGGLTFIMARTTHGEIGYSLPGVVEHPPAEDLRILERFAGAFDIAHRRFLDLKESEARAREVQIELGLERVRTQSMAMQHSRELGNAAQVFHEQLLALGIDSEFSYLWLPDEAQSNHLFWATWHETKERETLLHNKAVVYPLDKTEAAIAECYVAWESGIPVHVNAILPADVEAYFATWEELLRGVEKFRANLYPEGIYYIDAYMQYGCFGIMTRRLLSEEEKRTLNRFALEFERTYTRFLDLQRAEGQARTAMIETALERVRARALAMQQPEELREIAQVLRHEMGLLGVEELETSTVFIHDPGSDRAECWFAIRQGSDAEGNLVADHIALHLPSTRVGRQMADFFASGDTRISIPMRGPDRREWIEYCYAQSSVLDGFYGDHIPDRIYHLYRFSNGAIGAAAPDAISAESWDLLQRTASVFSLAYARFRDLTQARSDLQKLKDEKQRAEQALADLRLAQTQLIQAEKMASLGELTAGIAHEIQNPLNFVNNFAEVSNELLDELKTEGDPAQRSELTSLLQDNLNKINEHGKRADAIVKSMLQHSRTSRGKREPTDINALVDEYLRLAYHGMRAKDKSFNTEFHTLLDPALPKIEVIPEDIGRVVLNLINNAFYAVTEKKKSAEPGYKPAVRVSTTHENDQVVIRVADNGSGIPAEMDEKIFQPFFTTKPTGQGTGLGLSISYEIVTKGHQGQLSVVSEHGESTTFTICLPINTHPK